MPTDRDDAVDPGAPRTTDPPPLTSRTQTQDSQAKGSPARDASARDTQAAAASTAAAPGRDVPSGPGDALATRRGPTWLADEATIALRLLIIAAAGLGVLWLVRQLEIVVICAFLGFALTGLLWPMVRWLRRFLPAVVAALLSVLTFLAFFLTLFWFITSEVVNSLPELQGSVVGAIDNLVIWVRDLGITPPTDLVDGLVDQLQSRVGAVASGIGEAALTGLNMASLFLSILVLTLFLTIFGLTSGDSLARGFVNVVPAPRRQATDAAIRSAFSAARWWLVASTVTGLVDGLFIGLGMHLLGLPLAIPIGVLTFVLGFIPMVGATLAGAIAVLIGVFFGGPLMGLWVLLLVLAVQQIEGNVLSPLLLSRAMEFHPIVTLLLITAGGFTFGVTGLFLAVPLTGVASAAVRGWRASRQAEAAPTDLADQEDQPAGTTRNTG